MSRGKSQYDVKKIPFQEEKKGKISKGISYVWGDVPRFNVNRVQGKKREKYISNCEGASWGRPKG